MLSKPQISFINSLREKKFRCEHNLFVAEGEKIVDEMITSGFKVKTIYALPDYAKRVQPAAETVIITEQELKKISGLKTPNEVVAVAEIPQYLPDVKSLACGLSLVLDEIQDPGNLGTIIRIADWFGVKDIICSPNSADAFNPKVIQSTMGSFCRVRVHYSELVPFLQEVFKDNIPAYAAVTDGNNIYEANLSGKGMIILGNESRGISEIILKMPVNKISIPAFSGNDNKSGAADSLNVAIAAGIICSEFRRRGVRGVVDSRQ
jgi:TrmH family RNA methyltransferase